MSRIKIKRVTADQRAARTAQAAADALRAELRECRELLVRLTASGRVLMPRPVVGHPEPCSIPPLWQGEGVAAYLRRLVGAIEALAAAEAAMVADQTRRQVVEATGPVDPAQIMEVVG